MGGDYRGKKGNSFWEAVKSSFLSGPATKRGEGLKGVPLRKKELILDMAL